MTNWIETYHVVPAVKDWLTVRGYTWQPEFIFTNGSRADLIATHPQTGESLIIEVKGDKYNSDKVVKQIMDYGAVYGSPNTKLAIAIPDTSLRESLTLLCEKHGIQLILVECVVPETEPEAPPPPVEQPIRIFGDGRRWLNAEETKVIQDFRSLDQEIKDVLLECIRLHSTAPMEALFASEGLVLDLPEEVFKSWNRLA